MKSSARRNRLVGSLVKCALLAATLLAGISTDAFAQGSISGRVTGSDTPGAGGLPNTVVQFYDLNADEFSGSTTTDASGNYTMNLPASSYAVLTKNIAGYINEIYNNVQCSAVCDTNSLTPVNVTTTAIINIDFVLDPGSRISGTITDSGTGLPIAGVTVQFVDPNDQLFFTSAITDGSGNYITDGGSASGNVFAVTENNLGYQNEAWDDIKCAGCEVPTDGTPIAVTLGVPRTGINFALDAGGRIAGHVENSSHSPLANVEINISDSTGNRVDSASTDASGNFTSAGLPPGTYYAGTQNSGLVDELWNNTACPGGFCNPVNGTPITVTANATTSGINFVLAPGATISGTVTNFAGGAPITNANVSITNAAGAFIAGVNVDGSGAYTTGAVPTGTYFAVASATGFVNQAYNGVSCGNNCVSTNYTKIVVVANTATSNINFSMLATGTGAITGTVTDSSTGLPVGNLNVLLISTTNGNVANVSTNATTGVYTFSSVATGSYYVRTNTFGQLINELYSNVTCIQCSVLGASGGTLVNVTNGATTPNIDFALAPGGRITGTVTSAVGGGPVSGVPVQVFNSAGVQMGSFNSLVTTGVYATSGLPPDTYYLRTASGFFVNVQYNNISCPLTSCSVTAGTPVVVAGTATTSGIDFAMPSAGQFSGTVTNELTAAPINFFPVQIFSSAGILLGTANTSSSGIYTTGGLPAGTYYARTNGGQVFQNNGTTAAYVDELWDNTTCVPACLNPTLGTPITVTLLTTTTGVNFALQPGGMVSGAVTDASAPGVGLGSIGVQLYTASGALAKTATTNAAGGYTVAGLPAGDYFARTAVPGTAFYQDELYSEIPCGTGCTVTDGTAIPVVGGATANSVDFTLSPGAGGISGTVTDAGTTAGIAGVGVQIFNSSGVLVKTVNSAVSTGAYSASGLTPGTYYARTSAGGTAFYLDELWSEIPCSPTCTVTSGTAIAVTSGSTTTGVNFTLTSGAGSISGTMTDALTAAPVGGANVQIYTSDGTFAKAVSTNGGGAFLVGGLAPGTYFARTSNSLGYRDELYNERPCGVTCTVTSGTPITVAAGATTTGINFTLVLGGGSEDLSIDFGSDGLWALYNATTYQLLTPGSPGVMATGDIDGDGTADLIADFPGAGVWVRINNTGWYRLHASNASAIATGDLDGNGQDEVLIVFPGVGLWVWSNNSGWYRLHAQDPNRMILGDLDGNGQADVILNFPGAGIWAYENNTTWVQLHTAGAAGFAVGDLDGGGRADLIADFPGHGLWVYSNNTDWFFLHGTDATVMTAGDIDGSGQADAIISFPGAGIWAWMNSSYFKLLHSANGAIVRTADIDGNGRADVIISFPGAGIWAWMNDTNWIQLHDKNPQGITEGNLDGN